MKRLSAISVFVFVILSFLPISLQANTNDELRYRKIRVTFVPGLGTNGIEAHRYYSKYSWNILAGYHGGLEGYEVGLININREFARGFQVGGLNATGGDMSGIHLGAMANVSGDVMLGLQFTGFANISRHTMQGVQFAGFSNLSGADIQGIQLAGALNFAAGEMQGLMFAGTANISGSHMQGLFMSGIGNVSLGGMQGIMASGFANLSGGFGQGVFLAGVLNYAEEVQGITAAGFGNIATRMQGIQLSAFANIADEAQGIQVGVFNFARSFEGVPVGLISYYGDGRKNLDFWISESGFIQAGLKLGTRHVYNMVAAGYNPLIAGRDVWSASWTIGSYKTLDRAWGNPQLDKFFRKSDFTVMNINEGGWSRDLNHKFIFRYMPGKDFGGIISVYGGPSVNLLLSRAEGNEDYTRYALISGSRSGIDYRFWFGFSVGLQLFGH